MKFFIVFSKKNKYIREEMKNNSTIKAKLLLNNLRILSKGL
jgi:hypothetical protein